MMQIDIFRSRLFKISPSYNPIPFSKGLKGTSKLALNTENEISPKSHSEQILSVTFMESFVIF